MKMIRLLLLSVPLLLINSAFAQTKIIAHKSHSGSAGTFKTRAYKDNYGLSIPSIYTDSLMKISEQKMIVYSHDISFPRGNPKRNMQDTVLIAESPYFHYNPGIGIDSLRKIFSDIKFIGFEGKNHKGETRK